MAEQKPKIYWVVATPKGEPNSKSTYYFQECQMKQLAQEVVGLPLKISHNHVLKNGKESPPAGIVVQGHVHPQTGDVWAGFITYDNPTGRLARTFLGEDEVLPPELRMRETSLGFDIITDLASGVPRGHILKELSICYSGARPGCEIKGFSPFPFSAGPNPKSREGGEGGAGKKEDQTGSGQKYNSKIITQSINNYITANTKQPTVEIVKGKEKMQSQPSSSAAAAVINTASSLEPIPPRPDDAKGADQFFKNVNMAVGGGVGVVSAKASATYNETMSDNPPIASTATADSSAVAMMEKFIQQSQQSREKRPFEETPEQEQQKRQRHRLDFSKFVEGPKVEWQEPPMPEGLNEMQQQAFKQAYAGQKAIWERNQQMDKEIKRKFLNRLQGATDNFIPTYIEQAARESKEVDKSALEALMVGIIESPIAEEFVQLIEAQAKQGQDIAARQKDINQLEAEYQENLKKLALENAELRKNQARPPIAPPQQQQPLQSMHATRTIPQAQNQSLVAQLNEMSPIARIIAQASLNTNAMYPNRPGNKLPWELIKENSKSIAEAWERAKTQPY
jgi:hypothetical protein